MRPRILVNCSLSDDEAATRILVAYCDGVHRAGGLPLVIPALTEAASVAEALELAQGVLLIGGPDYHPDAYGEERHPAAHLMDRRRHEADLLLARAVLARRLPVLGICGGHQLLAIARGGALVQDLPSQWPNALDHRQGQHAIRVAQGSHLAALVGPAISVNTFHHQAVRPERSGGLAPVAWAEDGVIEALEDPGLPFCLGVQWHPERMPDEPSSRAIFAAFVDAARLHG